MRKDYYIIFKDDDNALAIYNHMGEGMTLPHFVLGGHVSDEEIKFMVMHFWNIPVGLVMNIKSSYNDLIEIYLAINSDTSSFEGFSKYEELMHVPLQGFEAIMNLDDESKYILENFIEFQSMEFNH